MHRTEQLSEVELTILDQLQRDARLSSADIAPLLNITATPTWRRIKRLEEAGVISGYRAEVDARRVGFGIESFITLSMAGHSERAHQIVCAAVSSVEEIVSCHQVSGSGDYMLRVVAKDMEAYAAIVTHVIGNLPGVEKVHSAFVLKAVKPFAGLPVKKARN